MMRGRVFAAYWKNESLEIFNLSDGSAVRRSGGTYAEITPVKGYGRKILVVGRERLFHARRRYPSAPDEQIKKAVRMEVEDLFPLRKPCYFSRIFEKTGNYILVDVWAWDCYDYEAIRAVFPFTHVVPEDLILFSEEPEVTVWRREGISYLLAHSADGFLGVSTVKGGITARSLSVFLKSLGRRSQDVRRINSYGSGLLDAAAAREEGGPGLPAEVLEKEEKPYPFCLDTLEKVRLDDFRIRGRNLLSGKIDLLVRAVIYLLLAYSLFLYMTARNYGEASLAVKSRIDALDRTAASTPVERKSGGAEAILADLGGVLKQSASPLDVMNTIARAMPADCVVKRMVLNKKNVELSLSSKTPLDVLKSFSEAGPVANVKLRGTPVRNPQGFYNFILDLEMK